MMKKIGNILLKIGFGIMVVFLLVALVVGAL